MNYNTEKYAMLLAETVPGVIETNKEYDRTEEIFNRLMSKGEDNLSPEESRLFALLASLLEDYERRTLPLLENSTPLASLKFLMEENNLKQKDIVDFFGTQSIASEVLSGKRGIPASAAKKLAGRFKVSADLFI